MPDGGLAPCVVKLPTLHADQIKAFWISRKHRRFLLRCGRRWGKTVFASTIAADDALKGRRHGYFVPEYKYLTEVWNELTTILEPIIVSKNKNEGVIRTLTGGVIEFWTLENEKAGRSRKYHRITIDEAAFTKNVMMDIWERSIEPTLLDFEGSCIVCSNTNGVDPDNFLYRLHSEERHGFVEYHAPTSANPCMPKSEIERLRKSRPELVFKQEYLAEFVDWSGVQFFDRDKLLGPDGNGVPLPQFVDTVFAVVDSATKTGKQHDGTAVAYWALRNLPTPELVLLDWDLVQIEGALLEVWLPGVIAHCEKLVKDTKARFGSAGVHIEDKASGMVLIQKAQAKGWPVQAIESKLTSLGKSERAIAASSPVYMGQVKFSDHAWNKQTTYHERTRNHMATQVLGFKIGAENDPKSEDDCLDAFTYGVIIGLGTPEGF